MALNEAATSIMAKIIEREAVRDMCNLVMISESKRRFGPGAAAR